MSDVAVFTLTIDGREVSGKRGQSVLEVARENGIAVPTLCHLEGLTPVGGCRLCIVEIEGGREPVPSCTFPAREGMVVTTQNETLTGYRRQILSLLFSERNHTCSVCVSNGHCELQDRAVELELDHIAFPYLYPRFEVDASHKLFVNDPNRCILCSRCIRVCDEIEGAHTWDIFSRGIASMVVADMGTPWGESESCTSCGKCVHVCPTGALSEKGVSVAEMAKRRNNLPYLKQNRERS